MGPSWVRGRHLKRSGTWTGLTAPDSACTGGSAPSAKRKGRGSEGQGNEGRKGGSEGVNSTTLVIPFPIKLLMAWTRPGVPGVGESAPNDQGVEESPPKTKGWEQVALATMGSKQGPPEMEGWEHVPPPPLTKGWKQVSPGSRFPCSEREELSFATTGQAWLIEASSQKQAPITLVPAPFTHLRGSPSALFQQGGFCNGWDKRGGSLRTYHTWAATSLVVFSFSLLRFYPSRIPSRGWRCSRAFCCCVQDTDFESLVLMG